jgi:hypothetical protein
MAASKRSIVSALDIEFAAQTDLRSALAVDLICSPKREVFMTKDQEFHYWLATSAVQFTGTKTVTTYPHGNRPQTRCSAQASLIVRADQVAGPVALEIDESHFAEAKLALGFTEDGRLTSSDLSTTGQGTQLLGAVASIIGDIAPLASGAFITADQADLIDVIRPFPQADLLKRLTEDEDELAKCIDDISRRAVGNLQSADPSTASTFAILEKALELVGKQRDRLTLESVAWAAGKDAVETFAFYLDSHDWPSRQQLFDGLSGESNQAARRIWDSLQVMVSVESLNEGAHQAFQQGPDAPFQQGAETNLWYRWPTRARLSVWNKSTVADREPTLVSSSEVGVLGRESPICSVPLRRGGLFSHNEISVNLGSNGTPAAITTDRDPGLAAALAALAGTPKLISTGISDSGGISTAWDKVVPSATTRETDELGATKARLQLLADIAKLKASSPS